MISPTESHLESSLPSMALSLLKWSLPADLQEPIIGDCEEGFTNKMNISKNRAMLWLFKQVISILWSFGLQTQRGSIMFLLSVLGVVGIMVMSFWLGGTIAMYYNFPSVIIVVVPAVLAGIICARKGTFLSHFSVLTDSHSLSRLQNRKEYVKTFEVMSQTAMLMAWFGVVTGLVAMTSNITKETFADVFMPAFAVCILTLLYGIIIKTLCYFAKIRILSVKDVDDAQAVSASAEHA